jgi:hypothetical protein
LLHGRTWSCIPTLWSPCCLCQVCAITVNVCCLQTTIHWDC